MFSIINVYGLSDLNPNASVFTPKDPTNIILQWSANQTPKDSHNVQIEKLDVATQIALDALWRDYVYEAICQQELDEEMADETEQIRATH